jgi:glycosyltransferase involved in cell wall biosynthesis
MYVRQKQPVVSVILPVFNGALYLRAAIDSIINQSLHRLELILIDDGSHDQSLAIAREYAAVDGRVVVLASPRNRGVVAALNAGLEVATGEFVARIDQDDVALPYRLDAQAAYLQAHKSLILVASNMLAMSESGEALGQMRNPAHPDQIRFALLLGNPIADPTVMFRRNALKRHCLSYNPLRTGAEDYDMWTRLLCYGDAYNMQGHLTCYRVHPGQMSRRFYSRQRAVADSISAALIADVEPGLVLTAKERTLLNWQYRSCLDAWMRLPCDGRTPASLLERSSAALASALPADWLPVLTSLNERRMLQRLVRSFVARHPTADPVLQRLGDSSSADA